MTQKQIIIRLAEMYVHGELIGPNHEVQMLALRAYQSLSLRRQEELMRAAMAER